MRDIEYICHTALNPANPPTQYKKGKQQSEFE